MHCMSYIASLPFMAGIHHNLVNYMFAITASFPILMTLGSLAETLVPPLRNINKQWFLAIHLLGMLGYAKSSVSVSSKWIMLWWIVLYLFSDLLLNSLLMITNLWLMRNPNNANYNLTSISIMVLLQSLLQTSLHASLQRRQARLQARGQARLQARGQARWQMQTQLTHSPLYQCQQCLGGKDQSTC